MSEIPKVYIVCVAEPSKSEAHPGTAWRCFGILSNGFYFGQHLCSDPSYALGDLYAHRQKRIDALRALFGIDPRTVVWKRYTCESEADLPHWWEANGDPVVQEALQSKYREYGEMTGMAVSPEDHEPAHEFYD
jgi:hypothetical protein